MTPKFRIYQFLLRCRTKFVFITFMVFSLLFFVNLKHIDNGQQNNYEPIDIVYTWVNGSDPKFLKDLNYYLTANNTKLGDVTPSRFSDKYELKFSLRSIEKYAPWVRHVFIVTNGQIPYWLDLDYDKVTLIAHKDIFPNSNDLPTFSSPAIESHLHRIPNLSKRFIYFNDDVFLGAPIYPEDFYTESTGYKLYFSWRMPPCAPDCPWLYVNDGACDRACYNENCQFDGDDCKGDHYKETFSTFAPLVIPFKTLLKSNITNAVKKYNAAVINSTKSQGKKRKKKFSSQSLDRVRNLKSRYIPNKDYFSASLQFTNRKLNEHFGYRVRSVPAHAPIMIDIDVMERVQKQFRREFAKTSSNKVRSVDDLQFSTIYYYFIAEEMDDGRTLESVFDEFDTDQSGTWSDREIRTILTRLYELPLTYGVVNHFEQMLSNCSDQIDVPKVSTPEYERYLDSPLPTISKYLICSCPEMQKMLLNSFGKSNRYKYQLIEDTQDSTFKMLVSNISTVVTRLDTIRKSPTKFICINDNLDPAYPDDNELIESLFYDFFMSYFPIASRYELPANYKNRFTHIDELREWQRTRNFRLTALSLVVLVCAIWFLLGSWSKGSGGGRRVKSKINVF